MKPFASIRRIQRDLSLTYHCAPSVLFPRAMLLLILATAPGVVHAQNIYTVSTSSDAGAGSLRQAIIDANNHQNTQGLVDRIVFSISGAGVQTILLLSDLPVIEEAVHIDGTTQMGGSGEPLIKVDGSAGSNELFVVQGDNTVIERLIIVDGEFDGIRVERHATHQSNGSCTIRDNYIGIDETGAADANAESGIHILDVPDCLIEGNVISGNGAEGVRIEGDDASGNVVQGNKIGTNVAGSADVANATDGVAILNAAFSNAVEGNIISGNTNHGVRIDGTTADPFGNTVRGNTVGLAVNGTTVIANGHDGVAIIAGASANIVGGPSTSDRNVISGNVDSGIRIANGNGNTVLGNYVGTSASGLLDRGNGLVGILIDGGSSNTIGGTSSGSRNVISGNENDGVRILANDAAETSSGNVVAGNYIGLAADGTTDLGNTEHGVLLTSLTNATASVTNNMVGGTAVGAGNVIAFNTFTGVAVLQSLGTAIDNSILGNSIYLNDTRGIDLANNDVTPNDAKDGDNGPNELQNFPSLSPWTNSSSNTAVTGVLNSKPNSTFRIEIFSTPDPEPTAHGEGKTHLGSLLVTTDVNGDASFTTSVPQVASTEFITATATEWTAGVPGSTSEFGQAVGIAGTGGVLTVNTTDGGDDGSCDALSTGGDCSLPEAIAFANSTTGIVETIKFAIPGLVPHTITALAVLTITDPVIIDGTASGTCTSSAPTIRIDGGGAIADGFLVTAGQTTIRGLSITDFIASGIELIAHGQNVIECNYIGLAPDGVTNDGSTAGAGLAIIGTSNNTIGGSSSMQGNVIADNKTKGGVWITGVHATGNLVQNNLIGTNAAGTAAVPNTEGVLIDAGNDANVIRDNLISGNSANGVNVVSDGNTVEGNWIGTDIAGNSAIANVADGVLLTGNANVVGGTTAGDGNVISGNSGDGVSIAGAAQNVLQGNFVGTDVTGTVALPNGAYGVNISGVSVSNTVGGTTSGSRNIISGNTFSGVVITGAAAANNVVQGNYVGADVSGTAAVPNTQHGIVVSTDADDTIIGGTSSGAGNVVSGNGQNGILVSDVDLGGSVRTFIFGNLIGTQSDGSSSLGNGRHGIRISNSVLTEVGGTSSGAGNTIAFNVEDGVNVSNDASDFNPIRRNSIFSNGGLGIELEDHVTHNGVTANDAGDGDGGGIEGPNEEQNFPIVASANIIGGSISITGHLSTRLSNATGPYRIEFFSSSAADASGNGEGRTFLGSTSVSTDATGVASFAATFTISTPTAAGDYITATATDAAGNTSEFGPALQSPGTGNITQTCALGSGWDWFSINVSPGGLVNPVLTSLNPLPTNNIDVIVDPSGGPPAFAMYNNGWVPGTFTITPGKGYKILLSSPSTLTLTGPAATGPIPLNAGGFNWIGMNSQTSKPIGQALANATLTAGDIIVSQKSGFSLYLPPWTGPLTDLDPCEAYRIKVAVPTPDFTFPLKRGESDEPSDAPWSVDPHEFENAMYVVGELSPDEFDTPDANVFVGAFVGDEPRGVVTPAEVEGRHLFFLMVFGREEGENVTFKIYDDGTTTDLANTGTFVADRVTGTPAAPYQWMADGVAIQEPEIPTTFALEQNYPNPFNPSTEIAYALPEASDVNLVVFDVHGREIRTLVTGKQAAGRHVLTWDSRDGAGRAVASGVYLYRLEAGEFVQVQKMILMK